MGNIVNTFMGFSRNNTAGVPFRRYSSLSNGTPSTPRSDKCTCDQGSSVTRETASAINTRANGYKSACKEVDNETMVLTTCSSSKSGCFTLSIAHTEPPGGDEANKGHGKPNETIHTDAVEHRSVSRHDSAGLICNHAADGMPHNLENGSAKKTRRLTTMISADHFSRVSPKENYSTDSVVAEGVTKGPARNTHKYKELRLRSVSPESSLFDHDAHEKLIDDDLNIGFESIPEASGNCEMVPFEDRAVCGPLDVRGSESSPKASLKRRAKRKRPNCKASVKSIVPTGNVGTLASPDVKHPEMVRSPLTRSKAKALSVSTPECHRPRSTRMGHLVVPPSDSGSQNIVCDVAKLPIIPFVEQSSEDEVLQATPVMIRTPLPHVRSSLTPSKAKVLSAPKIETLQLRSSRSGRLIVPRLDPATQSIIYNTDGSISGVTNSELQRPQGCESERPAKRRRKSQCPTPYRGRLLQFDGNI
ncbi:uncharacterized protein [Lolium perenne]|uniref:uncharacterized protein isoform X1 n=1 Tax=Lolium perenne TaxID=4522 RepID=UPI0021F66A2B|nr:uncharacterized protein LOC127334257 isoform X1 [Lolium perenne]